MLNKFTGGATRVTKKRAAGSAKARPGHRPEESVRVLISDARVKQRLKQLAKEIRRDFPTEPLHLIGVLKGSVFFLTDLARELGGEVSFDFLSVSSYGQGTDSTGEVKLIKDLDVSIEGKTVIVVEDILDTGLTLKYLLRFFEEKKPKHLRVVVLLDKVERRIADVRADYTGFAIPNEFVVGYGLDFDERYRNLPDVCVLQFASRGKAKSE
jgi:hypoxanthine phosphoribosyltransferase